MKLYASTSVVGVRPYRHDRGLEVAEDFIRSFHRGVHSFEVVSTGKVRIFFASSEPEIELRKRIASFYPAAKVYTPSSTLGEIFQACEEFCVAIARLRKPLLPVRTDFVKDPMNSLIACITGHTCVYQVVFAPAPKKYYKKILAASRSYQVGRVEGWLNPRIVPPGRVEAELSKALVEKAKSQCYLVEVRILALGEGCEETIRTLGSFFELFRTVEEQGFELKVVKRRRRRKVLEAMRTRELSIPFFGRKNVLSAKELALLVHLPGEDVTGDVEWISERWDLAPPADEFYVIQRQNAQDSISGEWRYHFRTTLNAYTLT